MSFIKPRHLEPGDTVAIISPSWGGPSLFPSVYEKGLTVLRKWGLKVREMPNVRTAAEVIRNDPKLRADDLRAAFTDPAVKAVIASIGGDDSVRILPYLDRDILAQNPKILMGFSDVTTLAVFCAQAGLSTLHGPMIMAGLSQMENLPESFEAHVKTMLFSPADSYEYSAYGEYCDGYPDWKNPDNLGKVNPLAKTAGWRWLQGDGPATGELFGGSIETLEKLKGSEYWLPPDFWQGKIMFLETSENKPSPEWVARSLRGYGEEGILDRVAGLIFGRARDYSDEEKSILDIDILKIVSEEYGRKDMPVISNFDAGHTDPQVILPLGVKAQLDPKKGKVRLVEQWLA